MNSLWRNEPVMVLASLLVVVAIAVIALTDLEDEQLAAVVALATLATGTAARSQVTPVSKVE